MSDMPLHKTEEGEELDRLRAELSRANEQLESARDQHGYLVSAAAFDEVCDERDRLRAELAAKEKALSAAKTVIEAKDKAYALIDQRFAAMAAKAATTDSERECNERLTAEIDALTAELAEAVESRNDNATALATKTIELAEARRLLNPRQWTRSEDNAWHAALTSIYDAFAAIQAAPVPAQPAVPAEVARAVQILRQHNQWRRGADNNHWQATPYSPAELGRAIDTVCDHVTHTAQPDVLKRATEYAHDIVTWLHRDHYSDNKNFEPFGDLLGLLSQIDNMICGWKESAQPAVPDDVAKDAARYRAGHPDMILDEVGRLVMSRKYADAQMVELVRQIAKYPSTRSEEMCADSIRARCRFAIEQYDAAILSATGGRSNG